MATGLVVLMMSVTGVILTYERQMLAWADRATYPRPDTRRAAADARGARRSGEAAPAGVRADDDRAAQRARCARRARRRPQRLAARRPVLGRRSRDPGAQGLRALLRGRDGLAPLVQRDRREPRDGASAITGASNLAFLFLVLSGIYLWLPRVWKWAAFKARLLFNAKATTAKARDFNWHHVFGIWSAIPLAVVVATATVFSYPWANDLVYRVVGEQPPRQGGGGGPGGPPRGAGQAEAAVVAPNGTAIDRLGYDALLARAAAHGEWRTLTLNIPADPEAPTVRIGIDEGNGGQPHLRHTSDARRVDGRRRELGPVLESDDGAEGAVVDPLPAYGRGARARRPNDRRARVVHEHPDGVDGPRAGLPAAGSAALAPQSRYDEPRSCLTASP